MKAALDEVIAGGHPDAFPLVLADELRRAQRRVNVNEVLAHLAARRLGGDDRVHPNDEVNRGRSSNDAVPTAIRVAAAIALTPRGGGTTPALHGLAVALLGGRAQAFPAMVKIGARTSRTRCR